MSTSSVVQGDRGVARTTNGAGQVREEHRNVDVPMIRCVHIDAIFFFQMAVLRITENEHLNLFYVYF
jgi:hypothetical protein